MKMSEKKTLPVRLYVIYLLIATFIFTGITFSKYVTSGIAGDSARVARIGEIRITETGDFTASSDSNRFMYIPGVSVEKKAELKFEGAEFACYVFLKVTPKGWTKVTGNDYSFSAAGGKLSWAVDDGWKYLTAEDGTYIYYCVVEANDAIIAKPIIEDSVVNVSENLLRSEIDTIKTSLLEIDFQATAVQLDGFGDFDTEAEHALKAWTSVSG